MPLYDYQCPANGVQIEIHHRMAEVISTWGELCERSGHALGDTPGDAPVEKMVGAGNPTKPQETLDFKKDPKPFRDPFMAPMRDNKF
jgi:hypothetical protein